MPLFRLGCACAAVALGLSVALAQPLRGADIPPDLFLTPGPARSLPPAFTVSGGLARGGDLFAPALGRPAVLRPGSWKAAAGDELFAAIGRGLVVAPVHPAGWWQTLYCPPPTLPAGLTPAPLAKLMAGRPALACSPALLFCRLEVWLLPEASPLAPGAAMRQLLDR
jgi:hypothetical protein